MLVSWPSICWPHLLKVKTFTSVHLNTLNISLTETILWSFTVYNLNVSNGFTWAGNSSGHNEDRPSSSTRKSGGANGMSTKLHLPVFGLASYKFKGSIWTSDSDDEQQQVTSLQETADKWLRDRQVNHPDFRFFASHLRWQPLFVGYALREKKQVVWE